MERSRRRKRPRDDVTHTKKNIIWETPRESRTEATCVKKKRKRINNNKFREKGENDSNSLNQRGGDFSDYCGIFSVF